MPSHKKKKILIRIGSLRHGGAEKVLATFLKNLPKEKYEIDLLLNLYSGKYLSEIPSWINVLYLNKGEMITTNRPQDIPKKAFRVVYQGLLKKFPKLLYSGILKNKKYDIEFAAIHGFRDEILNSPLKNSKKIIWIHNDLRKTEFHNYTDSEIRKFFGFDKIMVISEHIQNDFENLAKSEDERSRIVRIYNPLDTEEILKKAEVRGPKSESRKVGKSEVRSPKSEVERATDSAQHETHQPTTNNRQPSTINQQPTTNNQQPSTNNQQPTTNNHQPTFISVGTVFPQKGFDRLLRVHRRLLNEGFPHQIKIIGDGYDFENIKKLKTELGLDETVEMTGFTDNPYPYIKAADFYVLSSRYEGFPTVLFEAITLKKNIIATDVSGVREMLEDGKLGLIVDNSEEGIYMGMKEALQHPENFGKYQAALETYQMPFDLKNSVREIMEILDAL